MQGSLIHSAVIRSGFVASSASSIDTSSARIKPGVAPLRAGQGYSFVLRRLHSLSGIVPIGAFLIEHFISNSEATKGVQAYNDQVKFLTNLPFVHVLEWVFIFLPLLYHGIYGLYIRSEERRVGKECRYTRCLSDWSSDVCSSDLTR